MSSTGGRLRISRSQLLCNVCNAMFQQGLCELQFRIEALQADQRHDKVQIPVLYHSSRPEFDQAVADGCWICTQLNTKLSSHSLLNPPVAATLEGTLDKQIWLLSLPLTVPSHNRDVATEFPIFPNDQDWTDEHDLILQTSACKSTSDAAVIQWAALELNKCLDDCGDICGAPPSKRFYPTRVLEISDTSMRLVETQHLELQGHYATLSHCWGTAEFCVLTPETRPRMLAGIPINDLQPTFRDVCTVVRHLGIRWLWIDCYCILQGPSSEAVKDWERESRHMAEVYANGVMNVMACHASSPSVGLFATRDPNRCLLLKSRSVDDEGVEKTTAWAVYHKEYGGLDDWAYDVSDLAFCPLLHRRWVLQESMLASRILSFNNHNVTWQCRKRFVSIADVPILPKLSTTFSTTTFAGRHPFWALKYEQTNLDNPDHYKRAHQWFSTIIKFYCYGKLSHPDKDILRAMEGIGQHAAKVYDDEYYLGILKSTIPRALLWRSVEHCSAFPSRAPSWHWARYDSDVYHTDVVQLSKSRPRFPRHYTNPLILFSLSNDLSIFPQDISTETWPAALCIGRLIPLSDAHCKAQWANWATNSVARVSLDAIPRKQQDDAIDRGKKPKPFISLEKYREKGLLLPVVQKLEPGWDTTWGLIVRPTGILRYERIGRFTDIELPNLTETKSTIFYLV